ncbi:Uncharacterised protein [Enterobacter hormaechei]|nr:hypothetical protein [Enterobacter hormaechei]CZX73480.1 Uncharacterised protein [Enterobacter hormaechei]CZX88922.1 Uncharacterised protein [Enterobacter hormaechei]SAC65630.1 Uncharacterised protein [Enterobacter hormaechei]SAD85527.1 Uncharacterised protein [Enterobacter hormaechei]SAE15519.1 Uncharacterised protein [Enterobacter hormaechei]
MNVDRKKNTEWGKWTERGLVFTVIMFCIINYAYQLFRIFSA